MSARTKRTVTLAQLRAWLTALPEDYDAYQVWYEGDGIVSDHAIEALHVNLDAHTITLHAGPPWGHEPGAGLSLGLEPDV